MRIIRKIIGIVFYIVAAFFLLVAVTCFIDGFKDSNLTVMIGSTAIATIIAIAAFVIGWYIAHPGELTKSNSISTPADGNKKPQRAAGVTSNPAPGGIIPARPAIPTQGFAPPTPTIPPQPRRDIRQKKSSPLPDDYVVVDLEATDKRPATAEIIEIGAVKVVGRRPVETWNALVKPSQPLDPFVIQLTGITDAMLAGAEPVERVLPAFLQWCGGSILIGHNITGFDMPLIENTAHRKLHTGVKFDVIDTLQMSRAFFPEESHHRLSDLIVRFGIADTEEHRALSDAEQTRQCFEWMREYIRRNGIKIGSERHAKTVNTTPTNLASKEFGYGVPNTSPRPLNRQPVGEYVDGMYPVAISGEENHQDILGRYGADTWVWAELSIGVIPKGKYQGDESIWASVDGERIGWISSMQADRHVWRINDGRPHYCLACITQGKKKLEMHLILPGKYE
ncbi:PolC-type DNA polymerase III [Bifidobacterium longum subsp. suis]|uniref:3'-5' exonuclease n=1 Tax=Bifidobacterium longum TaxID=216816 RepID=UPI003D05A1E5